MHTAIASLCVIGACVVAGCKADCLDCFGTSQGIVYGAIRTDSGVPVVGFGIAAATAPLPGDCGASDASGQAVTNGQGQFRLLVTSHVLDSGTHCVPLLGRRLSIGPYVFLDTVRLRLGSSSPPDSVQHDVVLSTVPLQPGAPRPN
jgi:hypothetical protein